MVVIINMLGLLSLFLLIMYGWEKKKQILGFFRQKGLLMSLSCYLTCFVVHLSINIISMQTSEGTKATNNISSMINNAVADIIPSFSFLFSLIAPSLFFAASASILLYIISIILGYKKVEYVPRKNIISYKRNGDGWKLKRKIFRCNKLLTEKK